MNIVTNIKEWQLHRKTIANKTIGFVPTMGHLHAGHLSLCKRSQAENDITIVSIFINPTQFNNPNDFNNYPRTIDDDLKMLSMEKIDFLLMPNVQDLYPDDYQVQITETELSLEAEGIYRPGHFNGMLAVVLKLFNLVQPHRAYFGEKDYQQLLLIKKMVQALFLSIEVVACKTIRAEDGLALSSRNSRLTQEQREKATHFPRLLQSTLELTEITNQLESLGFKVDYIIEKWRRRLGAVWIGDIRLIDNIILS